MADSASWVDGPLVGFDLETTGTDPMTARIVTAAVVHHHADGSIDDASATWLVDPGIPIPEAASAVHGITTDHARVHGQPSTTAILEIAESLEAAWARGLPIVIFNAAYDLTLLNAALTRLGAAPLAERKGWDSASIIDPLVIDRAVDRYRKGKRTLADMTVHYGVDATDAHSAHGDAVTTCLLARALAVRHPDVAAADGMTLRGQQQIWAAEWATRFQAYMRSLGRADAVIDGTWPLRLR